MRFKSLILSLVLVLGMMMSSVVASAQSNSVNNLMFSDVGLVHENYEAIYFLMNTGVIEGYAVDGSLQRDYRPDTSINRIEFLALILKGTDNMGSATCTADCFSDVPNDVWYTEMLYHARDNGWISGHPDGTFKAADTINEVEALKILGEVLNWELSAAGADDLWYQPYFDFADARDILLTLDAATLMDRGDIAEIIFRNEQVFKLDLAAYDDAKVEELFELMGIPLDGHLGLGGIYGPGGPFGNAGAFYPGGTYVSEDGELLVVDETYFDDASRDCYSVGNGEVAGDTPGIETVLCLDAGTESSLEAFYTSDFEGLEFTCWLNETTTPETFVCVIEDTGVIVEPVEPPVGEVSMVVMDVSSDRSSMTAGGSTEVEVFVTDLGGGPLEGRNVKLHASSHGFQRVPLTVVEKGAGVYTATFATTLSGDYRLLATDVGTDAQEEAGVIVNPDSFDHVEILDVMEPWESGAVDEAVITVVGKDRYDNNLPFSSLNNNLSAVASLGTVSVAQSDGVFEMTVQSDDWGLSEVTIMDANSSTSLGESADVVFYPIQLEMPKGISEDTTEIEVPVNVFFPDQYGELGSYEFELNYDTSDLTYVGVADADGTDTFAVPDVAVDVDNGILTISQSTNDLMAVNGEELAMGIITFEVNSLGAGNVYVTNAVLTTVEEVVQPYVDKLTGAVEKLAEDFWMWWYEVKPIKDVCIDAFIFPGSGATEGDVVNDVAHANAIFTMIANSCNCDFFLNISVNVQTLTADNWNDVDDDNSGHLDEDEMDTLVANHPASDDCIPVYYVPEIDGDDLGWSWEGPPSEGVAMDHGGDNDNRTLAHELAHQLSGGDVEDPGDANSSDQGADDAGNLMNYDDTGDTLTEEQCELIEAKLP